MPEADDSGSEPNLELPSLGFGFRRRKKAAPVEEDTVEEAPTQVGVETEPEAEEPGAVVQRPTPGRRGFRLPGVPGAPAAVTTGVLVGLVGVLLTFSSAKGCASVRGVGGCGGFGLFVLIAIVAIEVLIGAALLRVGEVSDPTSTSLLAVGLVAVVVMLFFLSSLESRWMLLVIPLLTAGAYLLSWWASSKFAEAAAAVRN